MCGVVAIAATGVAGASTKRPTITFDSRVTADDGKGEPEVAVDVRNPRFLVDAYTSGLAASSDGGRHWREVKALSGGDPVVVADSHGNFFAAELGSYQFFESRDHGRTWTAVGSPLHNPLPVGPSPQDMTVQPADGPVYMGPSVIGCDRPLNAADPQTGTLYASCADHGDQSGGEGSPQWPAYFTACRTNIFSSGITTNCGRRYVSASHDGGRTWTEVSTPSPPGVRYGVAYVPDTDPAVLVAVGPSGSAFSLNDGRTWRTVGSTGYNALGFSPDGEGWAAGVHGSAARCR